MTIAGIIGGAVLLLLLWEGFQEARRNLAECKAARSEELVARDRVQAQRHKRAKKPSELDWVDRAIPRPLAIGHSRRETPMSGS